MATETRWPPKRIRKLRKSLGDTQQEFAGRLGLDRWQTISEWERGVIGLSKSSEKLLDLIEQQLDRETA